MKQNIITIVLLLILTSITAITSINFSEFSWVAMTILGLSAVKFILVAFQFMELKRAHFAWKGLIIGYLFIFLTIMAIVL